MCRHAMADPDIKAVLLCINSPGGSVSQMHDATDAIYYGMRGRKPCAAISDDSMYSAAYLIGSAADKVFVDRHTGGVGSLGTWTAHSDLSGMLDKAGIKVTLIYSGDRKVDASPVQPLSAKARELIQQEVDAVRNGFIQSVARNRGVSADALYKTEAAVYMRGEGIPLLADFVGKTEDALTYLRGKIASKATRSRIIGTEIGRRLAASSPRVSVSSEQINFNYRLRLLELM
jgi:ClpP class serine protease